MAIKQVVLHQYQRIVDASRHNAGLATPPEGWLRTVRKALGMSGPQLGKRLGITRARISQLEQAEISGAVTIKTMQTAAEALGCRFVYAIIPDKTTEEIIAQQARRKATALVSTASKHMALEDQALDDDAISREIERIASDLIRRMPPDFWSGP